MGVALESIALVIMHLEDVYVVPPVSVQVTRLDGAPGGLNGPWWRRPRSSR